MELIDLLKLPKNEFNLLESTIKKNLEHYTELIIRYKKLSMKLRREYRNRPSEKTLPIDSLYPEYPGDDYVTILTDNFDNLLAMSDEDLYTNNSKMLRSISVNEMIRSNLSSIETNILGIKCAMFVSGAPFFELKNLGVDKKIIQLAKDGKLSGPDTFLTFHPPTHIEDPIATVFI